MRDPRPILVVDDDTDLRETLGELLTELANDLAHGITAMRLRAAHAAAEAVGADLERDVGLVVAERIAAPIR